MALLDRLELSTELAGRHDLSSELVCRLSVVLLELDALERTVLDAAEVSAEDGRFVGSCLNRLQRRTMALITFIAHVPLEAPKN